MRVDYSKRQAFSGFLFVLPAVLGTMIFFLIPFALSVFYSLVDSVATRNFVGIQNYIDMFQNRTFQLAVYNTLRFSVIAIPLLNIFALLLALLLYRLGEKSRNILRSVYIFPLVLPVASVVLSFRFLFHEEGIINTMTQSLFHINIDYLHSESSFWVLIVLFIWKNCGYNVILFLAMLSSVPKVYYEEAGLQGAGALQQLVHITLPVSVPYLFFIFMISVVNSFKSFREAYALFGKYPNNSIYMLQHFINNNFENINYVRISTSSVLVFSAIFLLVWILFFLQGKWNERN